MVKDTINKLCTKYEKTSWKNLLPDIFKKEEFDMAIGQLVSDFQAGQPFTPKLNYLFKSFDLCPADKVKVVFITANPSPNKEDNDGLAFSGYGNKFKDSLTEGPEAYGNLEHLPKQGVMLLNLAMTCPIGKAKDHIPMWDPIARTIIHQIAYQTVKTVFVFVGEEVEHLVQQLTLHHRSLFIPSFSNDDKPWDNIDVFNRINVLLKKAEREPINW
jgi:uracil-DNA glycosylase